MYADKITDSMRRTINETERRREKQINYNKRNGLKPMPLIKKDQNKLADSLNPYKITTPKAEIKINSGTTEEINKMIKKTKLEIQVEGYKTLNEGAAVTFEPGDGEKGPVAKNIVNA